MINRIFSIIFLLKSSFSLSQKKEPVYFDEKWKTTTKENASYYRFEPGKKIDNLILIENFYINKTPQFQGYTLENKFDSYVGDIIWYDKNGFDTSFRQYYNFSSPVLTYYYPTGEKRKTIQYKMGKKDGETILYHPDGTVLIKGKYLNGKPIEGDFEDVNSWDEYHTKAHSIHQPFSDEDSSDEDNSNVKKQLTKTIIKKKVFWINSKQLAQETSYRIDPYRFQPIKQIYYDKLGKILYTLNENDFEKHGDDILSGTVYEFNLQNNFAISIKLKTNYKDGQKSGDQIEYNENGSVKSKRIYQKDKPFDGNFNEDIVGSLVVNQNYGNGVKQGEAIVKTKTDSIIAKGIYNNGKPYKGTFIINVNEDINELINVTDYKKTGLQKIFDFKIDNITKTYNCSNDILNGETIFYKNGVITGKLDYKNGLPYDGESVESKKYVIYKKGDIIEEIFYKNEYQKKKDNNIVKHKYYTGGKITKIVDGSFSISEHLQDFYEGIYKDDKPYNGYFATENHEFNYVNYYENGLKNYQYSNNYLENMDNYEHPIYDIKSTYKNEKIVDGIEYIKLETQFISKYWKKGFLESFDCDLFAENYFNRVHFELKKNSIEISELNKDKKAKIVIAKTKDKSISQLIIGDKIVMSASSFEVTDEQPKDAESIIYFEANNKIFGKILNEEADNSEDRQQTAIFYSIFTSNIDNYKTIQENFNILCEDFSKGNGLKALFEYNEEINTDWITVLRFNKDKKPEIGVLILKNKEGTYDLKSFFESKLIEENNNINFENIRKPVTSMVSNIEKKLNENVK